MAEENSVTAGKDNDRQQEKVIDNPTRFVVKNSGTGRDLNQQVDDGKSSKLIVENSVTAEKGNDKPQGVDDHSVILEKRKNQEKSQVENEDNFKVQEPTYEGQ